jgi:transcriptional regulator with PAS, ATPase and Fis domain/polyferredoxin
VFVNPATEGNQLSMKTQEIAQFLKQVPLFTSLSDEAREKISARLLVEEIPSGLTITQKDIPVACLYMVKTGRVQALEINEEGAEIALAEYLPGDYFGEISLLTGEPSAVTTRAVENTEVFVLFKMHFDEVLRENPPINRHFIDLLSERLRKVRDEVKEARDKELAFNRFLHHEQKFQYSELVGHSRKMKAVFDFIDGVAVHTRPVLIRGERGTGKELTARSIHQKGLRKDEPFIPVACENLAEEAWGSELFGHERGAIPGAAASRIGYIELAHKGTLLLKNVDRLPRDSQRMLAEFLGSGEFQRLGGQEVIRADIRVIATTEKSLEGMARGGEFYGELARILGENTIEVPSLREHKRDVPALVDHLLTKTAKRGGIESKSVGPDAMNMLLSYNYPGNVAELENVVSRAATLASGDVIDVDQIYLGVPPRAKKARYNLLKNKFVWAYFQSRIYPIVVRCFTVVFFAGIFYLLFFGDQSGHSNLGNILVLSVWWPSLFLFCFFAARSWCAICPIGAVSGFIQRFVSFRLPLPNFFKRTELWIPALLFVLILWIERITGAHNFPRATGFVLLAITVGAIVMSVIFERKVWCRYVCALGNMCGVYSMASILEVRANPDVCVNQCTTHQCFKGGKVDGCPMFRHALFLEENQSCRVCTYCVKNCPYHAVQVNVRPPGEELWTAQKPITGGAFFSILLATLVFAVVIPDFTGFASSMQRLVPFLPNLDVAAFTALMTLVVLASLLILWSGKFVFTHSRNPAHFARYAFAFVPLALCSHFANQLRYLPGVHKVSVQLAGKAEDSIAVFASFNIIWPFQLLLVIGGVLWSLFVVYKNFRRDREEGFSRDRRLVFFMLTLISLYGVAIGSVFIALGRVI